MIDVVVHPQLGEDIAGHELALDLNLLAALDFGHSFGRDFDFLNAFGQPKTVRFGEDCLLHLVLEPGIRVNDVPASHELPLKLCVR